MTRVSGTVKGQIHQTMVRGAMIYGIGAIVVRKVQERKTEVAEMKMLRWPLGLSPRKGESRRHCRVDLKESIVMA